jgi:hypothetical protein
MNTYAAGVAVTITIPLEDMNGEALTPTALSWRLLDETEAEVKASVSLSLDSATEAVIVVDGSYNMLSPDQTEALRAVELTVATAAGAILLTADYALAAAVSIVTLKNSFQTYGQAKLTAQGLLNLDGWAAASDPLRRMALVEAFKRLTRFGYRVKWPDNSDLLWQSRLELVDHQKIPPRVWNLMTTVEWTTYYPEDFRTSMRRAQVVEANDILAGNIIEQRREAGLLSESIGESSMMFRSGKPLKMGISAAALREIEGYIDIRMTMTRT